MATYRRDKKISEETAASIIKIHEIYLNNKKIVLASKAKLEKF